MDCFYQCFWSGKESAFSIATNSTLLVFPLLWTSIFLSLGTSWDRKHLSWLGVSRFTSKPQKGILFYMRFSNTCNLLTWPLPVCISRKRIYPHMVISSKIKAVTVFWHLWELNGYLKKKWGKWWKDLNEFTFIEDMHPRILEVQGRPSGLAADLVFRSSRTFLYLLASPR